jgi:hypothetical protein
MHSPYPDGSFDSRYLHVVRHGQLRGTMRPVLTWLPDGIVNRRNCSARISVQRAPACTSAQQRRHVS